ncbi:MAG: FapA family protein [Desulfobulbaceae bacterium]|nr:FapA family protein [Desulfobulbaceae bacterium]HIJ79826.1 DUF342 domain-containing protein [Deltaproteobacteria bacterium]
MEQTSVIISNPDRKAAREEGALKLGVLPKEVTVKEAGEGQFEVSLFKVAGKFEIFVQPDKMAAFIKTLSPPQQDGEPVTAEDILTDLANQEIICGINTELINQVTAKVAADGESAHNIRIAEGKKSSPGQDSRIEYKIGVKALSDKPEAADMVKPGQVIAVKIPAAVGTGGQDIYGQELEPLLGADQPFSAGANVLVSEDKLTYTAEIYGKAIASRESVLVSNLVEIAEDRMSARMTIMPIMADTSRLSLEDVLATLAKSGVVHGIHEDAIKTALDQDSPQQQVLVAEGSPAQEGTKAVIKFGFRMNNADPEAISTARQEGKINNLEISKELVKANDVLAKKIPAAELQNGCTVTGETLEGSTPPEDKAITAGENVTVLDDGLTYVVANDIIAGYADYNNGTLSVEKPLRISEDKMHAYLTIHPPARQGKGLTAEIIINLLKHRQIKHGIIRANIKKAIELATTKGKPLHDVIIAKGKPPVEGQDGRIDFPLNLEKTAGTYHEDSDLIDFRERGMIKNVQKGMILAHKIPAQKGIDGYDIFGNTLPAVPGIEKDLFPKGNVAVSEDGLTFTAEIEGMATLIDNDKIGVFEMYEIAGDVDYSTGNLAMDGMLNIKGWIRSGFTVTATGDILVGGGIEDATVESAANILVKGGIVSQEQGKVKAKGDITARFVERARLHAGGNIYIHDEIMRSKVSTDGFLSIKSGKGRIRGGTVSAIQGIEANEIGSTAGVITVVMAATNLALKKRINILNRKIIQLQRAKAKMDAVLLRYTSKNKKLPPEVAKKISQLAKQRRNFVQTEEKMNKIKEAFCAELGAIDTKHAKITVKKSVYIGTIVVIGGQVLKIMEDITGPATFMLDDEGKVAVRK